MKKVVLIGDSIRMGYQEKVRELLAGRAEVWAPEENGGNSENVLAHLEEWVLAQDADVLHINCGLHDIKKEFGSDAPAVTSERYADNVRAILSRAKEETDAVVAWATSTPVNQEWHHANKQFDRFEEDIVACNRIATDIAAELGAAIDDLYAAVDEAGRDGLLLADGVHFKPEGYALLGRRVADFVDGLPGQD